MSATATQPPVVPPRPSRSQDRDQMPKIPPRPANRRVDCSANVDRFAPSPLNESPLVSGRTPPQRFGFPNPSGPNSGAADPIDRSSSVDLPSLGEEGKEYAVVAEEYSASRDQSSSPEQTRNVDENLKLHAPRPSLPAMSAKQRVAAVTRTDSDKAASFGIGKPSSEDPAASNRSLKKKASTTSQLSATTESHVDDEHGIPEIGQQVPMYPNAGDVQAPSPAPGSEALRPRHHARKTSARGFAAELPPGSYGLHGHGVKPQDKLEKAYYEKRPEVAHKELNVHHHDRPNDFSMSREELNKIVRETAERGISRGVGTPSEQVGWEAIEESTSRITSPRPASTAPNSPELRRSQGDAAVSDSGKSEDQVIHVGDPRRRSVMFDDKSPVPAEAEDGSRYSAPILAEDEIEKNGLNLYDLQPAVSPPAERSGSAFEMEPSSRPTSRPASLYRESSLDLRSTPLEDVEEYEPLFPEDEKAPVKETQPAKKTEDNKQRFPSRDIWEDAPDSAHGTAEVSTPDVKERSEESVPSKEMPPRETETPAHAFARRQEQLAEAESRDSPDAFLHRSQKPLWVQSQPLLAKEVASEKRPSAAPRFPSRDVWEDTPDSLKLETTVSHEQDDHQVESPVESKSPELPQHPVRNPSDPASTADKPAIPERPKPKQTPSEERLAAKPVIPERPKPQIPARPVKSASGSSKDGEAAAPPAPKAKPVIPARPTGSKIAALQAGFMADLNKRLQLGPQAPKLEEPVPQESSSVEQEKAPLVDARKGRARGPQRRAPAKSPAPVASIAVSTSESLVPTFSFSTTCTVFSIDPEEGSLSVAQSEASAPGSTGSAAAAEPAVNEAAVTDEKELVEKTAPPTIEHPSANVAEAADKEEHTEEAKHESLATNMAGETLLEVDVEHPEKDTAEPVKVEEDQMN